SEDSRAARSPPSLHLSHCTRPGRPCQQRNRPLKPALSENAEKFCERRQQQSEFYQARLRQDFVGQRTPAESRVCCPTDPQPSDNDVRNRSAAFLRRSHSNDDPCTDSETLVSTPRNSGRQSAQQLSSRLLGMKSCWLLARGDQGRLDASAEKLPTPVIVPLCVRLRRSPP